LVNFSTLNIKDKSSILKLLKQCDKANGYVWIDDVGKFIAEHQEDEDMSRLMLNSVHRVDTVSDYDRVGQYDDDDDADGIENDSNDDADTEAQKIQLAIANNAVKSYEKEQQQQGLGLSSAPND
jgi:hypothetical protein